MDVPTWRARLPAAPRAVMAARERGAEPKAKAPIGVVSQAQVVGITSIGVESSAAVGVAARAIPPQDLVSALAPFIELVFAGDFRDAHPPVVISLVDCDALALFDPLDPG